MTQTKARQALDKSRRFVKTTIYIYRIDYRAQIKAIQTLDLSRSDPTTDETIADYQRIYQDPVSEFFLNKKTHIYARGLQQERFSVL